MAAPPAASPPSAATLPARIAAAFPESFPDLPVPFHYQLGLLLLAVAMVLLPLVYAGLIALTGYGLWYHATANASLLGGSRGHGLHAVLFLYLAPLVIGGLLVLFMVKPLFARRTRKSRPRQLDREAEPLLFDFVARLCHTVGAPVPAEIHVDCDVNASAGFRQGWRSLFRGDLVLTIGLPLAGGLTVRQFAGVLAHEFGHFAQRAGMRATYVINSVNAWFLRVVYERDEWDEALDRRCQQGDFRLRAILYVARSFVWLTRKILWVLMVTGHGLSCYMSREMEYDADRHEVWLAGSAAFEATHGRVLRLSLAHHVALRDLGGFWDEGRLPDDLPGLISHEDARLPAEAQAALDQDLEQGRTGWFDTHPCGRDRIARARAEHAPGLFRLEDPASAVFSDFTALAKAVSEGYYREALGPRFRPAGLHPLPELVARKDRDQAGGEALRRFFQGRLTPLRPLALPATPLAVPADPAGAAAAVKRARERMLQALPGYLRAFKKYDDADTRVVSSLQATALLRAKMAVAAKEYHLAAPTLAAAGRLRSRSQAAQESLAPALAPFEASAVERLLGALSLLHVPELAAKVAGGEALRAETAKLLPAAAEFGPFFPAMTEVRNSHLELRVLLAQLEHHQNNQDLFAAIRGQMGNVRTRLERMREALGLAQYPFDHAEGKMSLCQYALPDLPAEDDLAQTVAISRQVLDNLYGVYYRLVSRLAFAAERVEAALGLERLPEPPEEKEEPTKAG